MAQEDFREAGAIFKEVVDKYGGNSDYLTQVEFAQQQLQILDEAGVI